MLGWAAPRILQSDTRLRIGAVWEFLVFALNGLVFILIGLQLSTVLGGQFGRPLPELVGITAVISVSIVLVRFVWAYAAALVAAGTRRLTHLDGPEQGWRETFVIGWAGLRGVVSLALALALPLDTTGRDVLVFVTFGVILVTLVGQGLTLPVVTRWLRLCGDGLDRQEEMRARSLAADAAVARIEELAKEWPAHLPLIDTLRSQHQHRATHLADVRAGTAGGNGRDPATDTEQELLEHRLIRRAVIDAERSTVLGLRDRGTISDEVWRRLERDLDLEELRMEA